ncbi:hypothetical protein HRED_07776 [Candidatus Haloredivivus sp. G17]|nr:hypothetical protein HRED_07776 [Candidatus Haloredivivus sp. G17]
MQNIGEYDLIVAQEIDRLYEESTLYRTEAVELFEDMLKSLKGKILYSISGEIGFKAEEKSNIRIKVEETNQGLKFSQKDRQNRKKP